MNCRAPKVDAKDRPCFRCGGKGRMAINRKAPQVKHTNLLEAGDPTHVSVLFFVFGRLEREEGAQMEDEE